ncbi:probable glucan endo-1,3-beta-glucosidase A6 [Cryptomeria japonica]|uniref:probable glucan endo-1,3-beta-glucosidase A6 n=1 Tax=Cryptomeria japonica TaxID=3369 RepID=UPI0027DA800C|nr:probable glucan endo-1,3-beta-glucosidase A6 [Cryptomeria japonica]
MAQGTHNRRMGNDSSSPNASAFCLSILLVCLGIKFVAADSDPFVSTHAVGINYGRVADNLPTPAKAVELMKSINAGYVKIYDADSDVLKALANSSLPVVITIPNDEILGIASSTSTSDQWVQTNVVPYYPLTKISMIMVGNEILSYPSLQSTWTQLVPAMQNIHNSLQKNNLDSSIKVTTSVAMDAFSSSYPPSNGTFKEAIATSVIKPMLSFLDSTDSYFFLDVYPFFAWNDNPVNISLNYALFGLSTTNVEDGTLGYTNILDAQLDAAIAAMQALGYDDVKLAISETGWPTKGDSSGATVANAAHYNTRLVSKLLSNAGTPRRPKTFFPTFVFALFNEDLKSGAATEQNWGVFYADGSPVYDIDLSAVNLTNGVVKLSDAPASSASSSSSIFFGQLFWAVFSCSTNLVLLFIISRLGF